MGVQNVLGSLENNCQEIYQNSNDKFQNIGEKINVLQTQMNDENELRENIEGHLTQTLADLEKNSKKLIDNYAKEREESDQKMVNKLSHQIDELSADIQRDCAEKMGAFSYVQQIVE